MVKKPIKGNITVREYYLALKYAAAKNDKIARARYAALLLTTNTWSPFY